MTELGAFPNGEHDDFADVLAYACIHWRDLVTGGRGDLFDDIVRALAR